MTIFLRHDDLIINADNVLAIRKNKTIRRRSHQTENGTFTICEKNIYQIQFVEPGYEENSYSFDYDNEEKRNNAFERIWETIDETPKQALYKSAEEEGIIKDLEYNFGKPTLRQGNEILWQCPICKDEGKDNLSFNIKTGMLYCFAGGKDHVDQIMKKIHDNIKKHFNKKRIENCDTN